MSKPNTPQSDGLDRVQSTRSLLENFETVGFGDYSALIPVHEFDSSLRENVRAATLAASLDLASVDYAKKRYFSENGEDAFPKDTKTGARYKYVCAYFSAKHYIKTMMANKDYSTSKDAERLGTFGASVALLRLRYSFFSAHILYLLGHQYEAHAVSRLILEQIAWAYSAHQLEDPEDIKRLVTTSCISRLKELKPEYGRLYGFLSNKVHIDAKNHGEFLGIEDEIGVVYLNHANFKEYARIVLALADIFGIVWEISLAPHIRHFEATVLENGIRLISDDRPFKQIATTHLIGFDQE